MAPKTPRVVTRALEAPLNTMTVEMAPGPASSGTPSGMMPTSSFAIPSACSAGVSRCWLRRACTMSSAFRPIRIPPAILNAPIVMPNSRKIRPPPSANAVSVIAQVHAPRRAIARRTSGVSRAVIARKLGTAVSGSTMNRTEVKIRNSSCRVFIIGRSSDRHLHHPVLARPFGLVHRGVGLAEDVVRVEVDQRQRAAVPAVAAQLLAQLLGEGARVEDGGERVLGRELVQLPLRPPQLRQPGDGDPDHREVRALVREPRHERCAGRHLVDPPDEAQ